MYATARASSRSKPRRFGISSRKSVSAAASSSPTRRSAPLSLLRSSRMVALMAALAPSSADASRRDGLVGRRARRLAGRLRATLERPALVFRPFLAFAALALFGFFMGILLNEGLRGFTKTG